MRCSQCHKADTKVIESRDVAEGESIRRRRECTNCNYRFTTYERIERPQLVVIKSNSTRELYNRDKLMAGLLRACEKTSISSVQLDKLVADIEHDLYSIGNQEVSTSKIGDIAMNKLAILDEVAYVRFASVYKRFTNIAGFEKELSHIRQQNKEL
ncbi:MAG: transcriptional regulator NrdR [bacterium]|jgi:transcriptional repressor NrdR